ncbi:MAG: helix-turn-helix transcriptional regulator [Spirochaetes bacterium]|nr:helix-turn-helix transcriptional regulator [Spirochaetota bacterium]
MAGEPVYSQIPIVIMMFNLSLLVPLLIFYLLNRRIRMLGFSTLVLVMFILFTGLQFIPARYTGIMVPRLHLALMPFFGYFMVKSVQIINRVSLPLVNSMLIAASVLSSAIMLCLNRRIPEVAVPYLLLAGLCITIMISLLVLAEIKRNRRDIVNSVVAVLFMLLTAGIILYEVAYHFVNGTTAFLSLVYSSPVFVLLYIFILARDYMRSMAVKREPGRAVRDLESKKNRKPTITDLSEGKLEMIIDFIRNNYTRELSREGMACAIGMSTDYMSRLFKKYTGKKLNEFINVLRIREAESLLRTRDVKIIDIALSVGFESLPTFNRVFKNITGRSPSRYRRMFQPPRTGAGRGPMEDDHRANSPPSP